MKDNLTDELIQQLKDFAAKGMGNAYCPVSEFPVGAAVLTQDGNIYQGCNVESVISGLGTCAERCAIDHSVAHGEYMIRAIGIISKLPSPIQPCGACLQYINEFAQVADNDVLIFLFGADSSHEQRLISEMLPNGFGPCSLDLDLSRYRKQ